MTNMTDAVAKTIAEKTIQKYKDADRKAAVILEVDGRYQACISNLVSNEDLVEAALNLIVNLTGDDAEAFFKIAAKQAKQLKKARKHDTKH